MPQDALPTLYQQFIHLSRYSRWLDEEQRRETWPETVSRYFDFFEEHLLEMHGYILTKNLRNKLERAVLGLESMPSMRCLMTAGEALKRENIAGYNCCYVAVDKPSSFDEILYILMNGTGVGFSVERQFIANLPTVADEFYESDTVIKVRDSKLGWSKAFKELIGMLYVGQIPAWDMSLVRPAGAPLKTFGGRASGPEPLEALFKFAVEKFKAAAGRKLTSIECHDIVCKIAEVVVVGGVRRSALISLSNLSDDRMRSAKSGQWWDIEPQRALANNSACYTERPDIGIFMDEWKSLYDSKSGERGIFNRVAAQNIAAKNGRRDFEGKDYGTNPCCFTADMKLLTSEGYKNFGELSKQDSVEIVNPNGSLSKGKVWSTGEKDIVKVLFHDKSELFVTPDHVFMLSDGMESRADKLKGKKVRYYYKPQENFGMDRNEEFFAGFILGDGQLSDAKNESKKSIAVYFNERERDLGAVWGLEEGKNYTYTPENLKIAVDSSLPFEKIGNRGLPKSNVQFLSGLFSANGSVIKNARVSLKTIDKEQALLLKDVLREMEIEAYITANKSKKQKFPNGEYLMSESYDVNVHRFSSIVKFAETINFAQQYKRDALDSLIAYRTPKVRSVSSHGTKEVFDFTEPETHWGVVNGWIAHNSEIILLSREFCNLSEVVVRHDDTLETLKEKVKLATILGTFQSTLTNFKYVSKIYKNNCSKERLLGVSMTGIMDNDLTNGSLGQDKLAEALEELKQVAVDTNKKYANDIGIEQSVAITCVKPSGCASLDTVIKTDRGDKSMAEIFSELSNINLFECSAGQWLDAEDEIYVYDENDDKQKIEKLFVNGFSEVYDVEFEGGNTYSFTGDHKLKTSNGWVRVSDLKENDIILSY